MICELATNSSVAKILNLLNNSVLQYCKFTYSPTQRIRMHCSQNSPIA